MTEEIFEDENFQITKMSRGKNKGVAYQFDFETCYRLMSKEELIKSLTGALKALSND